MLCTKQLSLQKWCIKTLECKVKWQRSWCVLIPSPSQFDVPEGEKQASRKTGGRVLCSSAWKCHLTTTNLYISRKVSHFSTWFSPFLSFQNGNRVCKTVNVNIRTHVFPKLPSYLPFLSTTPFFPHVSHSNFSLPLMRISLLSLVFMSRPRSGSCLPPGGTNLNTHRYVKALDEGPDLRLTKPTEGSAWLFGFGTYLRVLENWMLKIGKLFELWSQSGLEIFQLSFALSLKVLEVCQLVLTRPFQFLQRQPCFQTAMADTDTWAFITR